MSSSKYSLTSREKKQSNDNLHRLGSGTGLFTRSLLASPSWTTSVRQLKAVEPSDGMRAQFIKSTKDDRVTCSEGVFDSTGVEDGWADVIIIAQVFDDSFGPVLWL
jgi:hypothetical protein